MEQPTSTPLPDALGPRQQPTDAPHPFDQPSADVVLRTSDCVNFRVHSLILAQASPFFASMFELPQPPVQEASRDIGTFAPGLPVIDMAEDSVSIDFLLRLLYPIPKPEMEDPVVLVAVLKAAIKYEMAWPVAAASKNLQAIIPRDALKVWAAACSAGLDTDAITAQAAEMLRSQRAVSTTSANLQEALPYDMNSLGSTVGLSAGDYFRLKQFLRVREREATLSPRPNMDDDSTPGRNSFVTGIRGPDVACCPASAGQSSSFSDGSEGRFLAHQSILSMYSPVLMGRIEGALSTRPSNLQTGFEPVELRFDEGADVLSALLDVCYRGRSGLPPNDLPMLANLLIASAKYEMAQVTQWVNTTWDEAAATRPLEAYCVAINFGLRDRAKDAARKVLEGPITDTYRPILETTPAMDYHRLLLYCDSCFQAVKSAIKNSCSRLPRSVAALGPGGKGRGTVSTNIDVSKIVERLRGVTVNGSHGLGGDIKGFMDKNITALCRDLDGFDSEESSVYEYLSTLIAVFDGLPHTINQALTKVPFNLA